MHWATLGLFVDFLIRLVAGPGPSVLTQLARLPVARMKPQFTYGASFDASLSCLAGLRQKLLNVPFLVVRSARGETC